LLACAPNRDNSYRWAEADLILSREGHIVKRLVASVAVALAVVIPTSAAAEAPAKAPKFDCAKAAAAWKKLHKDATPAQKQTEVLKLATQGSCNIKPKSL
jgi:hypothetical protein